MHKKHDNIITHAIQVSKNGILEPERQVDIANILSAVSLLSSEAQEHLHILRNNCPGSAERVLFS